MPRGKLKGGGHGNGKGGRWDGGGGGLSKDQRDALDHVVKRQQKKEKREEEERIRRIVQRERDRDSDSSSQSDRDRKRSSKRHGRKHRGHSSDDSDSDDSAMSGEKQRRRQKERRDRRKAKKKKEIEEGKAAQLELKELREELTRLKASTETKEAKYSVAEVQEILAVCREKARTPTQQAKPPRDQPQPRSLFESITCSTTEVHIEELEEGKPASESESKASQIITLLADKLQLAEQSKSFTLGLGSTQACRRECERIGRRAAQHFTTVEEVQALKKVLVDSNIDSQAKQANTIISKLLEGIATRKVTVTNTELQIE